MTIFPHRPVIVHLRALHARAANALAAAALAAIALAVGMVNGVGAQSAPVAPPDQRIDVVTPLAPELASLGAYAIGVRTISVTDRNRRDVLRMIAGDSTARYDRSLTLEVWYPAAGPSSERLGEYRVIMRDPSVTVSLFGRAMRDATPRGKRQAPAGGPSFALPDASPEPATEQDEIPMNFDTDTAP